MRILTCYKFMFFHLVICLLPYFDVFLQCKLYFFNFYEDKCISHFLWPLDFEHRLKCFSIPVLELIHAFFYGCLFFLPFLSFSHSLFLSLHPSPLPSKPQLTTMCFLYPASVSVSLYSQVCCIYVRFHI